jgi:membrane protein
MIWLDHRTDGWFLLLFEALRDMLSFKSSLYAAATAYFTLYSIFPLILLTVGLSTIWFQPYLDSQTILEQFEFIVPALDELLGQNLDQLFDARAAITRLSAVILIWSASSIVYMLTRAMDAIWEEVMVRPAWRHRALAIIFTIAISILLMIGSFGWSVVVPILDQAMPDRLIDVAAYVGIVGSALLSATVFTLLYKMLPHTRLDWSDVMLGAVLAGVLWEVAKHGFLFFVTNYLTLSNLIYGSMTAIIAFLTWAYISMLIFLYGAHVNVHYRRRRLERRAAASQM